MTIYLTNLRSTRKNNQGVIHVDVVNNGAETTAQLSFSICDETHQQSVEIKADARREVTQQHNQSGLCTVRASEENSGDSITLLLDLDQPESA